MVFPLIARALLHPVTHRLACMYVAWLFALGVVAPLFS
jgi:hypothetical protein